MGRRLESHGNHRACARRCATSEPAAPERQPESSAPGWWKRNKDAVILLSVGSALTTIGAVVTALVEKL